MRNCDACGRPTTAPVRVVTEARDRAYPRRPKVNVFRRIIKGKRTKVVRDDPGGVGWEIVHEGWLCPACVRPDS